MVTKCGVAPFTQSNEGMVHPVIDFWCYVYPIRCNNFSRHQIFHANHRWPMLSSSFLRRLVSLDLVNVEAKLQSNSSRDMWH
ncbi:hypothetical protein NPIL_615881 [Nephila pilipes]|uniref:Uncharacterized protein n=1 Tax=Nephila pilipes TaxID=299642 RepID=A0A8X6NAJ1_NEPPI|nr:hypothetical protein NPIL_615881 [Nephila pilipes]